MSQRSFNIEINEIVLNAAYQRGQRENKSASQLLADLISSYAQGYTPTPQPLLDDSTNHCTVTTDLPDAILGAALHRLKNEGKSAEQAITSLLIDYAQKESTPPPVPNPEKTPEPVQSQPQPQPAPTPPTATTPAATPIPGVSYGTIPIVGRPTDRPAEQHGDINLALRGYAPATAKAGLIDMNGATDSRAPQLTDLLADKRTPQFTATYRIHEWQWASPPNPGTRGKELKDFEANCVGLQVTPGETIHVPSAGYDIGRGYQVMVLYASDERITLTYTGEDSVVHGYSLHLEGVQVEPSLLALYQRMNANGRHELPGLQAGQALGRAKGNEIKVAIRDTGRFMDPRVRKDWWRGR